MGRRFKTLTATDTGQLDALINAFAAEHLIVNVDAHCYDGTWYAFVLFEDPEHEHKQEVR